MDKLKDIAKGGWQPKGKDGGKESWRGDFKGVNQVASWVGKGKQGKEDESSSYSEPYVRKDPSLYPPPPKTKRYAEGTGPVAPNSSTPAVLQEQPAKPDVRPGPFEIDTTGVDTKKFPTPPVRRSDGSSPRLPTTLKPKPPSLPPRLPPRESQVVIDDDSVANSSPISNQGPSQGFLNQSSLTRLGKSGISVPGFDIGGKASPSLPARSNNAPSSNATANGTANSELQSRFSHLNASSPSAGTTWAQKQAALKTANDLKTDPSKVSLSEIRSAATTAKSFQERHGDQVASGLQSANSMNQKYGLADRMKGLSANTEGFQKPGMATNNLPRSETVLSGVGKKAPPPPPAKHKGLQGGALSPPPLPLSSKPNIG